MPTKVSLTHFEVFIANATETVLNYLPKIAGAIIIWIVGIWIINRITKIISKAMEVREFDISLRGFLKSLLSVTLKILLLFSIAGMLGLETTSFVTVLGAAGLAVGLALQGSLSNFAGGVLILIFKPFKVGDKIEAQGKTGKVQEIQIFNTILITSDNKSVIIPNGPLSNGTIVNITREGNLSFEISIDVSYKNKFDFLKELITNEIIKDSRIESYKVTIQKMGTVMTLIVKGTTSNDDNASCENELLIRIKNSFEQQNVLFE